jgi:hypothetical protein
MYYTATILTLDQPTGNGRTYTTEVAREMIEQHYKRHIQTGKASFGQFGYPTEESKQATIDLNSVSHVVESLRVEDGKLVGTIRVLGSPLGNILKELLLNNTPNCGFRPRGLACVTHEGVIFNYEYISIDFTRNPA